MHPDDKGNDKKWGTIYLDASRESTVEKLDAMQAASRREQMQQRTEQEYLEKVRAKATDRAKEILGQAYTERQHVLDEVKQEAERLRQEAEAQYALAACEREEAQKIREAAQEELRQAETIRQAAQGEGFNAGLEQAQQELEEFRGAMGASVAGVLGAIHSQCGAIFEGWRQEMVELLKVCVEKGTGLVLDEQYPLVLEHLVMEAVRQLDDRHSITLRVHPDDESAVADMFAAARERLPNIGQWIVAGDPALQLGGLIAESQSGTVDSRLELHQQLVENILQHLVLPASSLESEADRAVAEAVRQEAAKIALLAPPPPPAPVEEVLPEYAAQPETLPATPEDLSALHEATDLTEEPATAPQEGLPSAALSAEELPVEAIVAQAELEQAEQQQAAPHEAATHEALTDLPEGPHPAPNAVPADAASLLDAPAEAQAEHTATEPLHEALLEQEPLSESPVSTAPLPAGAIQAEAVQAETVLTDTAQAETVLSAPANPTRDELEHELFDLLPTEPPSRQDEILAQGGFLDSPSDIAHDGEHRS